MATRYDTRYDTVTTDKVGGLVTMFHRERLDSSIESRTVSKFPGFVWITVVQETEEKFGNNSSKLAEQNKEKKSDLNTK